MDWGHFFIEKVANQFLVEGKEIESRVSPYIFDGHIPSQKGVQTDLLHSFDKSKYHNYNQKEEEDKIEAHNEDDL